MTDNVRSADSLLPSIVEEVQQPHMRLRMSTERWSKIAQDEADKRDRDDRTRRIIQSELSRLLKPIQERLDAIENRLAALSDKLPNE